MTMEKNIYNLYLSLIDLKKNTQVSQINITRLDTYLHTPNKHTHKQIVYFCK